MSKRCKSGINSFFSKNSSESFQCGLPRWRHPELLALEKLCIISYAGRSEASRNPRNEILRYAQND